MDDPEKLATSGGGGGGGGKRRKTQHNMCWTPLYASKQLFYRKNILIAV